MIRRDWFDAFDSTRSTGWKGDSGIKVIGPCMADGSISVWHYDSLESAKAFAEQLAKVVQESVVIVQVIGRFRPTIPPVEYIQAAPPVSAESPEENK